MGDDWWRRRHDAQVILTVQTLESVFELKKKDSQLK